MSFTDALGLVAYGFGLGIILVVAIVLGSVALAVVQAIADAHRE